MDKIRYITIDNQRIAPLRPTPRIVSVGREATPHDASSPFGIVDRVTISPEGRRKAEQFARTQGADAQVTARPRPLLTYIPETWR